MFNTLMGSRAIAHIEGGRKGGREDQTDGQRDEQTGG